MVRVPATVRPDLDPAHSGQERLGDVKRLARHEGQAVGEAQRFGEPHRASAIGFEAEDRRSGPPDRVAVGHVEPSVRVEHGEVGIAEPVPVRAVGEGRQLA